MSYRVYHSLPAKFDEKGKAVTLKTALKNLIKWIQVSPYSHVAFCTDSAFSFRLDWTKKLFPNNPNNWYKANRKELDESLKEQIADCYDFIKESNYSLFIAKGYEADDLIASLVNEFKNVPIHLLSNDKDFCSLFSYRNFRLLDKNRKVINVDYVKSKFGIIPEQFTSFLALTGDSSDNISGIKGIGVKTAAKLLNQFYRFEDIIHFNPKLMPEKYAKLIEADKESALISYSLVKLKTNLLSGFDFHNLKKK